MNGDGFELFSTLHLTTLLVCTLLPLTLAGFAKQIRKHPRCPGTGRRLLAGGNLGIWILAGGFWFHPDAFRLEQSLPLQFCNLANLIAAAAVGFRLRTAQALLYFWTFALCLWAFLTPFLTVGPSHLWFWVFWLYHLLIPLATSWVLTVDGFRPDFRDLKSALVITLLYTAGLALLNALTGWNYGFVGPGKPGQPSLIDLLGPYPLRLLWMALIGIALFFLLLLPWRRRGMRESMP